MGLDPFAHSLSSKEMRKKYYLARNGKDRIKKGEIEKSRVSVLPRDLNSALLQQVQVNAWDVRRNTNKMHKEMQNLAQISIILIAQVKAG